MVFQEMVSNIQYTQDAQHSYLELALSPEASWSEYQIKMMMHNAVLGLLPVEHLSMNGERRLRYRLTGLTDLELYRQRKRFTAREWLLFCLQMVDCLKVGEDHLLDLDHYVWDSRYVYVDLGSLRLYMTYLPIGVGGDSRLTTFKSFLLDLTQEAILGGELSVRQSLEPLLHQLEREQGTLAELGTCIHHLLDIGKPQDLRFDGPSSGSTLEQTDVDAYSEVNEVKVKPNQLKHPQRVVLTREKNQGKHVPSLLLVTVLANGLICAVLFLTWAFWLRIIGSGLSALLFAACMIIPMNYYLFKGLRRWVPGQTEKPLERSKALLERETSLRKEKPKPEKQVKPIGFPQRPVQQPRPSSLKWQDKPLKSEAQIAPVMGHQAVKLTEWLVPQTITTGTLVDELTGERHRLSGVRFVVGRQRELVDLHLDETTIGRVHAEIQKRTGGYFLVDLNSKNGTYKNDERVVSNLPVVLFDGDRLTFVDRRFRFERSDQEGTPPLMEKGGRS
jgi:hypothetical protein